MAAKAIHLSSAKNILNSSLEPQNYPPKYPNSSNYPHQFTNLIIRAARKNKGLIAKGVSKTPRRVITIPASTGGGHGKWTCEYLISLKDLHLHDLAEDGRKDTAIFVTLSLQKHTGLGMSVDGRVITNIARTCTSCSSPYSRKIDTSICVWVLPDGGDYSSAIPQIGGDDPSVIYAKPGSEAELDSLIQDTIRLQIAVKETCSESCEKSEPNLHYIGDQRTASLDRRWSSLLHLRKVL